MMFDTKSSVSIDLRNATLENEVGGGGYISQIGSEALGITIAYNSTGDCILKMPQVPIKMILLEEMKQIIS